jgi:hypothetical protein
MSEFELLQLEYMEYERQQGLISLIQSQADLISNDATMMSTLQNLSRLYLAHSMWQAFLQIRSQPPTPRL